MIDPLVVIALIWVHCWGDFIVQTDTMAKNKSKSNKWLATHVFTYSIWFLPFGLWFTLATFAIHFVTDYVSSRLSSQLFAKGKNHEFWVVVGVDQALHLTALILTYIWLA